MHIVPYASGQCGRVRCDAGVPVIVGGDDPHAEAVFERGVDRLANAGVHEVSPRYLLQQRVGVYVLRCGEAVE